MDNKKILIVDDDKAMRGLLRLRLSDTYEIIETGDPEEALEAFHSFAAFSSSLSP